MSQFLDAVHSLLGPPAGAASPMDSFMGIESTLGVIFPEEYKDLVCHYGPGMLCNDIRLYHPTMEFPPFGSLTESIEDAFARNEVAPLDFWDMDDGSPAPFSIGAGEGNIIPFGDALNWVTLYFIISSDRQWEVLEYSQGEYERSGLSFESWVLRYLNGGGSNSHFVTAKPDRMPPYFTRASAFSI